MFLFSFSLLGLTRASFSVFFAVLIQEISRIWEDSWWWGTNWVGETEGNGICWEYSGLTLVNPSFCLVSIFNAQQNGNRLIQSQDISECVPSSFTSKTKGRQRLEAIATIWCFRNCLWVLICSMDNVTRYGWKWTLSQEPNVACEMKWKVTYFW